jgi:hypothetical protein
MSYAQLWFPGTNRFAVLERTARMEYVGRVRFSRHARALHQCHFATLDDIL